MLKKCRIVLFPEEQLIAAFPKQFLHVHNLHALLAHKTSSQDHGVELLLMKTRDLVSNPDPEVRRCILTFYGAVVRGQFDTLDVMRAEFFRLIEMHSELRDDFVGVFDILFALTKEGKTIDRFADKIGSFLFRKGFPIVLDTGREKLLDFLQLTRNVYSIEPRNRR